MRTLFLVFGAVAIAALVVVVGSYFYEFGPGSGFAFSSNMEDWARFGEYVGGALGPIYGLLAFGGVLITVAVQRQQLNSASQEARLGELAQLLARSSLTIDSILAGGPRNVEPTLRGLMHAKGESMSVFSLLAAIGVSAMDLTPEYRDETRRRVIWGGVIPSITTEVHLITIELQQLVRCLEEYAAIGGANRPLVRIYRERYQTIVSWLHVTALLDSAPLDKYFKPQAYIDFSRAARNSAGANSGNPN